MDISPDFRFSFDRGMVSAPRAIPTPVRRRVVKGASERLAILRNVILALGVIAIVGNGDRYLGIG